MHFLVETHNLYFDEGIVHNFGAFMYVPMVLVPMKHSAASNMSNSRNIVVCVQVDLDCAHCL
jgi:hypothetical protein